MGTRKTSITQKPKARAKSEIKDGATQREKRQVGSDAKELATKAEQILDGTQIQKSMEFKMFFIWHSLPSVLIGKPESQLREIGINDPDTLRLLSIRTQGEFAATYKLREATLSEWKTKIKQSDVNDSAKDFFKGLTKNVIAAFYAATLQHADAGRVRLWLEEFEGKKPEAQLPPIPAMLGPQFTQVIINLKQQYNTSLRNAYEQIIRERGDIHSVGGVRTDSPDNGEGGAVKRLNPSRGDKGKASKG